MPRFTKQSYGIVAEVMRSVRPGFGPGAAVPPVSDAYSQWERTCLAFLNHFQQDNPAFERDRFLKACKGE